MALTQEVKARYRQAGPSVMLALLSELRVEAKRVRVELQRLAEHYEQNRESDASIAETFNEALMTFDRRVDPEDEAARDQLRKLRNKINQAREEIRQPETMPPRYEDLFSYCVALLERERWIRNELKRQDLLPVMPDEAKYLAEDA